MTLPPPPPPPGLVALPTIVPSETETLVVDDNAISNLNNLASPTYCSLRHLSVKRNRVTELCEDFLCVCVDDAYICGFRYVAGVHVCVCVCVDDIMWVAHLCVWMTALGETRACVGVEEGMCVYVDDIHVCVDEGCA